MRQLVSEQPEPPEGHPAVIQAASQPRSCSEEQDPPGERGARTRNSCDNGAGGDRNTSRRCRPRTETDNAASSSGIAAWEPRCDESRTLPSTPSPARPASSSSSAIPGPSSGPTPRQRRDEAAKLKAEKEAAEKEAAEKKAKQDQKVQATRNAAAAEKRSKGTSDQMSPADRKALIAKRKVDKAAADKREEEKKQECARLGIRYVREEEQEVSPRSPSKKTATQEKMSQQDIDRFTEQLEKASAEATAKQQVAADEAETAKKEKEESDAAAAEAARKAVEDAAASKKAEEEAAAAEETAAVQEEKAALVAGEEAQAAALLKVLSEEQQKLDLAAKAKADSRAEIKARLLAKKEAAKKALEEKREAEALAEKEVSL